MPSHQNVNSKRALLPRRTYLGIIKAVPITTVDLIIRNHKNEILFGLRKNQPAKNSWFIPGGRLLKSERIIDALNRIYKAETGIDLMFKRAKFLGVFELFFNANFAEAKGVKTHNISLAYEIKIGSALANEVLHADQHSDYRWFALKEILKSPKVHPGAKAYFAGIKRHRSG